jgi:hypothetical protein
MITREFADPRYAQFCRHSPVLCEVGNSIEIKDDHAAELLLRLSYLDQVPAVLANTAVGAHSKRPSLRAGQGLARASGLSPLPPRRARKLVTRTHAIGRSGNRMQRNAHCELGSPADQ